jgi:hypothetical protein
MRVLPCSELDATIPREDAMTAPDTAAPDSAAETATSEGATGTPASGEAPVTDGGADALAPEGASGTPPPEGAEREWWDPRSVSGTAQSAASATVRPLGGLTLRAFSLGVGLASRAAAAVLRSAGENEFAQRQIEQALNSKSATTIAGIAARSAAFEELLKHLPSNEGLWSLIDTVAASPAVRAAVARQGYGLADEVGVEVRGRARSADDYLERVARSVTRGRSKGARAKPAPTDAKPGESP